MAKVYTSRFGRRPSRGIRPWLLLPKVIAVALYLGGLAAALVVWLAGGLRELESTDPRRLWLVNQVGMLIEHLAVPALLIALAFGVALFCQHPRQFVRMRWLVAKLISLAVLLPSAHFYCSSRLSLLRQAFAQHRTAELTARELAWALGLTLAASLWIVVLGRLKPRLGQNWARSYRG